MEINNGSDGSATSDDLDHQAAPTNNVDTDHDIEKLKLPVKKALLRFRCKLQDAILGNYLLERHNPNETSSSSSSTHESSTDLSDSGRDSSANSSQPVRGEYYEEQQQEEDIRDITVWGVPLLPSKGHEGTDIILLKFLKARDYKVSEAFKMLQKMLKWREEFKAEGILKEKFGSDLDNVGFMDSSTDKEGHPLCYMVYGAFKDQRLYQKMFGKDDKCDEFLRWRVQFMEKGIQKLSLKAGGVDSMIQITDMKNCPGPSTKQLHSASKKAITLLQNYYPEFILKDILVNVPFWYYAYHKLFSRILTQRAKKKFILTRPSRVAKTLLRFISPESLPIQYGGLKRENDEEFLPNDLVSELIVKAGAIESIQIPVAEPGVTVVWDLTVVGWDVNYKEEFIPDDDCSYRILIQKENKTVTTGVRNSFYISEPGTILLTIDNGTFKKKRVLYRSKTKPAVPMYIYWK